jgi:polysaccharide export outer membrane protein
VNAAQSANTANFLLIDLNAQVADYLRGRPQPSFGDRFGKGSPVRAELIGIGDVLEVMIWEADPNGLFASGGIVNRGAIPAVVVDTAGKILIPYAGTVQAAGRTPRQVALAITEQLKQKTVEPQVHVSVRQNVATTVTLTGDVAKPGVYPLTLRGDNLIDLIAQAGGTTYPSYESLISLTRRGVIERAYVEHVINTPSDNIFLKPGDEIHIERKPQTFAAFGAVEKKGQQDFGAARLSVLEAVGKTSGLSDDRADPTGVFLLRFEDAKTAYQLIGQDNAMDSRPVVPVIYRIDLKDPNQYFFAEVIPLRDRDIIYVANAPAVELDKFLTIVAKTIATSRASISVSSQF